MPSKRSPAQTILGKTIGPAILVGRLVSYDCILLRIENARCIPSAGWHEKNRLPMGLAHRYFIHMHSYRPCRGSSADTGSESGGRGHRQEILSAHPGLTSHPRNRCTTVSFGHENAPTGHPMPAQGNALGKRRNTISQAL